MSLALSVGCLGGPVEAAAPSDSAAADPVAIGPLIPQPGTYTATVSIDASSTRQRIEGFGSSVRLFSDPHLIGRFGPIENALNLNLVDEDAVLDSVYERIGLTRARMVFQSNGMQASPNAIPRRDWVFADGHIDLVKRARPRGLQEWWLSPLSLEPWMSQASPSDYADWAMQIIRYWRSQGVELTWYSIANEPGLLNLSGEFIRDAVKLIGRRLAAEGLKTRLVIPDDVNPIRAAEKANIVLSDPDARKYVAALASHIYDTGVGSMKVLSDVAIKYNLPLWMSEFSVNDPSPLAWASLVDQLLADFDVSGIDYMWGFFGAWDPNQLLRIHETSGQFARAEITPAGYAMAQYARYVRPGAVRVGSISSDPEVRVTAFMRNGSITIVALNAGNSRQAVRVSVTGLAGLRRLNLIRTSAHENLTEVGHLDVASGAFNIDLPARSISTFVQ